MLNKVFTKMFGSRNDRLLKKMDKDVERINAFESDFKALDDEALKAKTVEFKDRIKAGDDPATMLPDVIAFEGGVPIRVDGHIIGSVGVSGVRSHQDAEVAQAGIDAFLFSLKAE